MITKRIKQFRKYIKDTCKIGVFLAGFRDSRLNPDYSSQVMGLAFLTGFITRTTSTRHLERRLKKPGWRRFIGLPATSRLNQRARGAPVEGTLRYSLPRFETATLRAAMVGSVKQMHRSKMISCQTLGGLKFVSIDGTQQLSTKHFSCDGCIEHKSYSKDSEGNTIVKIWYDHKVVTIRQLGDRLSPWLGFISQKSSTERGSYEGEQPAAIRALEQIVEDYGKERFDGVVVDALHVNGPFLRKCEELGLQCVLVAKDNASSLRQSFESKKLPAPIVSRKRVKEGYVDVIIWEQKDICLTTCDIKLRILKIKQVVKTVEGKLVRAEIRWLATTIPQKVMGARNIWWVGWRRWEIENGGHRSLKREHHAMHVFCHKNKVAVENLLWLQMWGQNLLEAFIYRRLNSGRFGVFIDERFGSVKGGLCSVVEDLVVGLVTNKIKVYWGEFTSRC